jgi:hypothetical protein
MLRTQLEETRSHSGATNVAPHRYWPLRNSVTCQGNRPSILGKLSHPPRFGRIPHNWLAHVTFTNLQSFVVVDCRLTIECSADEMEVSSTIFASLLGKTSWELNPLEVFQRKPCWGSKFLIGADSMPGMKVYDSPGLKRWIMSYKATILI